MQTETINFMFFVCLGSIFVLVFDFFRALRKIHKPNKLIVTVQDVIYFLIIGIVLVIVIINLQYEVFRMHLIYGIVLGAVIYTLVIRNKVRDLFVILINASRSFVEFVFLPVKIQIEFWGMICKKIKKCVKLCCKKKSYMIEFYHKKVKVGKHKGIGINKLKKEES